MSIASNLSFVQNSAGAITTGTFNSGAGPITFSINGAEHNRIDGSGYSLFGYTTSQGAHKLQVNGNIYASGNIIGNITGNITGVATTATNLAGGLAGQLVYQVSPGISGFINTSSVTVGTATNATNLLGGAAGGIHYQSAASASAFLTLSGTANSILAAGASAPQYVTQVQATPSGTGSSSAATGQTLVVTAGGVGVTGDSYFAGSLGVGTNLTVTGNLTVQGTTTQVNSTITNISDPIITIGGGTNGAAPTADDSKDRGIAFQWFDSSPAIAKTGFFGFDRSSKYFTFLTSATLTTEITAPNGGTTKGALDAYLAGGAAQSLVYQSAADTTAFLAAGTAGQILQTNGTGSAPSWISLNLITANTATNLAGGVYGNIPYQTAPGTTAFIGTGSAIGQLLQYNGPGVAPTWISTSSLISGFAVNDLGGSAMALRYNSAANASAFLAAGTAGQILQTNGTASAPTWISTSTMLVGLAANLVGGAIGSIPYQSAANTTALLAPGTSGFVLQTNGAGNAPTWQSVGSLTAGVATTANTILTVQQPASAVYYPTFVDANNVSTTAESLYTTSSFNINPSTGAVTANSLIAKDPTSLLTSVPGLTVVNGNTSTNIIAYAGAGNWNPTTQTGDSVILFRGAAAGSTSALNIVPWSNTATGIRITNLGIVTIASTVASISTMSGALIVAGGLGIGGNIWIGGSAVVSGGNIDLRNSTTSSIVMASLAQQGNTTVFEFGRTDVANTPAIDFHSSGGNIDFDARISSNGGNTATIGQARLDLVANQVYLSSTQSTTSTVTGALRVEGGVGIGGGLVVGGTVTATTFVGSFSGNITGSASQVNTVQQTANATYYPTFVDFNNASATGELVYTTSSFAINPATGNVFIGGYNVRTANTLDLTALNTGTFYPVTIPVDVTRSATRMRIQVGLNSGSTPGWGTHPQGFAVMCDWTVNGSGYGTIGITRVINNYSESWTSQTIVGGIAQMGQSSTEVIYLRGGGRYFFESDGSAGTIATVQTGTFTTTGQTVTNTTTVVNSVWQTGVGGVGLNTLYLTGPLAVGTGLSTGAAGQILQSNGNAAPTWVPITGLTAGNATTATNIASGLATQVPYQSGPGATTFSNNLTFDGSTLTAGYLKVSPPNTYVTSNPAVSGTTANGVIGTISPTGFNQEINFGINSSTLFWLQNTNKTAYSVNYPIAINPNGGNVLIGTTTTLGSAIFGVNGATYIAGITTIASITGTTSTNTGALTVAGGVGVGGDVSIGGKVFLGDMSRAGLNTKTAWTYTNTSVISVWPSMDLASNGTVNSADGLAFIKFTQGLVSVTTSTNRFPQAMNHYANTGTGISILDNGILYASVNRSEHGAVFITSAEKISGLIRNYLVVGKTSESGAPSPYAAGVTIWNDSTQTMGTYITAATAIASTSTNTGALVVDGGVGIGGDLNVGGGLVKVGSAPFGASTVELDNGWGALTSQSFLYTVNVTNNILESTGGLWARRNDGVASRYEQSAGQHQWFTYASGSAGATSFANPVMKLDADGGLVVNGTVTATNFVGSFSGSITGVATQVNTIRQTANATYFPVFVDANNATAAGESVYTTSSFSINPATGHVGIGTTNPTNKLTVSNGGTVGLEITPTGGYTGLGGVDFLAYNRSSGVYAPIGFVTNSGNNSMVILTSGNVGVGTITPAYKLEVNGSFAATTKSFVINHPTKPGMKLRYGSLEGPENGVYFRGKLTDSNKIELPEYWTKLVDPDSITVSLTSIGKHQDLYVADIADNVVTVGNGNILSKSVNCFYVVYGERCDVDKLVVEIE